METSTPAQPRLSPKLSGDAIWALTLALLTFFGLLATERAIGFTRDESVYFYAGGLYWSWILGVFENLAHGRLLESFSDPVVSRALGVNSEHPILMKVWFGLSHWLFFEKLHWLRQAAAYRAPAWAAGGLGSALIFLIGRRLLRARSPGVSRGLALFAVGAFWLTPRSLYDGHLACFDMPITVAWLAVVYCYLRGLDEGPGWATKWKVLTGVAYGLALATKLNAFFYPAALALHWAIGVAPRAFKEGGLKAVARSIPGQWIWMALLGPAIFLAHWPYLWPHPIERIGQYLRFHAGHVNYPWYYLHILLRDPPFPLLYVVVVTALTVPLPLFALMTTGTFATIWRLGRQGLAAVDQAWLLVLINGLFPLLLISWPTVPHFGGTKHWLSGMPFLSLIAADALWRVAESAAGPLGRLRKTVGVDGIALGLGGVSLFVALVGCIHTGGYGDSAYNELAGEFAGATELGMERQFWSNNVTGVLDWLNHNAPAGARVYFHEVTYGSVVAYHDNDMLRADIQPVQGDDQAQFVPYQYMQEFRQQEFDIWNSFGTNEPVDGLYLDESPNVTVYRRPGT
jgi:hypothetical protein